MRIPFLITCLLSIYLSSTAQKIDYTIPDGYEKNIIAKDYKKIVGLALPIISKRYKIISLSKGSIETQEHFQVNLHNLILKCAEIKDKTAWQQIIEEHFSKMFTSMDDKEKLNLDDFETAKKYLSLRIYDKISVDKRNGTKTAIYRIDIEGTYTFLMFDLPDAFTNVGKEQLGIWKKDSAEIFKIAQANINKQPVEKLTKEFDIDKTTIEISFIGEENYAASFALDLLANSPELVGEWGSVIAMPNKGLVDICRITKEKPLDFVKFIQMIKPLVDKSYDEHPQRISDQYFWYYKQKFIKIHVTVNDKGDVNVIAPIGLGALMTKKEK
jgi:hypothetical protein